MKINWIKIQNFKSIKNEVVIDNLKQINALIGLNGSGKSNILEAIYSVCSCSNIEYNKFANFDLQNFTDIPIKIEICLEPNFKNLDNQLMKIFFHNLMRKVNILLPFSSLHVKEYWKLMDEFIINFVKVEKMIIKIEKYKEKEQLNSIRIFSTEIASIFYSFAQSINRLYNTDFFKVNQNSEINFSTVLKLNTKNNVVIFFDTFSLFQILKINTWKYDDASLTRTRLDIIWQTKGIRIHNKYIFNAILKNAGINIDDNAQIPTFESMVESITSKQDAIENAINMITKKYWPEFNKKWKISFLIEKNIINYEEIIFYVIDKKNQENKLRIEQLSSGEKQFLSIILSIGTNLLYDNSILLIDEPEIYLDYFLLEKLRNIFNEISNINPSICIIFTTHKFNLININKLDECFNVVNKQDTTISCRRIVDSANNEIPEIIYNVFNQTFSSNNSKILILEREKDCGIYEELFKRHNENINCIPSGGAIQSVEFIKWFIKLDIKNLQERLYVILDGDKNRVKVKNKIQKEYKFIANHVFTLNDFFSSEKILKIDNNSLKDNKILDTIWEHIK